MSQGRVVISTDSHTELVVDLKPYLARKYYEEFDDGVRLSESYAQQEIEAVRGMQEGHENPNHDTPVHEERRHDLAEYTRRVGMEERLKVLDEQGVAGEFIVPFTGAQSVNPHTLHAYSEAYNRYFEEYVSPAPFRFRGANVVNLLCGIDTAVEEVAEAYEHGFPAVELPGNPKWVSKDLPTLNSPYFDPLWAALNERGMAMIFHAGHGRAKPLLKWEPGDPGWQALCIIDMARGHRDALTYVLLAGVLERFPNLKLGYLESGTRWIPPILQELDTYARTLRKAGIYEWERLPSEQWNQSCFAGGGVLDVAAVQERHDLGVRTLVWGSDYPHVEGTYPHTGEILAALFAAVPDDETQAILAENPARLFGFDLDQLADTAAAKVPWPELAGSGAG
jgi:predicted TIM-barrel fold metal-dependent hydrolase